MKNIIIFLLTVSLFPLGTFANNISDLQNNVQSVREKLIILLVTQDSEKQTRYIKDIRELSKNIDSQIQFFIQNPAKAEIPQRNLAEFKQVWEAFRTTRDKEIIPKILSGDPKKLLEAKKIAKTVQSERFQKMQLLLNY